MLLKKESAITKPMNATIGVKTSTNQLSPIDQFLVLQVKLILEQVLR